MIQNQKELLANAPERAAALNIIEAGFSAINTGMIIKSSVSVSGNILKIKDHEFNLDNFKRIRVIGFGKASCEAALALESVLGSRIHSGVVIDVKAGKCEYIDTFIGTHPQPSNQNLSATKHILEITKDLNEEDLILVIVSGGGSALLCWPESECEAGERLYHDFLKTGGTIQELNTVRKHISSLKGGGLAKLLYPATVAGLIFCDMPESQIMDVASGPTFPDTTTIADAENILDNYGLNGYSLHETPKENIYFEKVTNILIVSNSTALEAMSVKAKELGLEAQIISREMFNPSEEALASFKKAITPGKAVIAGGEVKLVVKNGGGSGGRNSYLALCSVPFIGDNDIFISVASDGIDNSDAAGVIVDSSTLKKISELGLNTQDYHDRFDSYNFFKQTGDLIFTGPTNANVSDLMLWIRK